MGKRWWREGGKGKTRGNKKRSWRGKGRAIEEEGKRAGRPKDVGKKRGKGEQRETQEDWVRRKKEEIWWGGGRNREEGKEEGRGYRSKVGVEGYEG